MEQRENRYARVTKQVEEMRRLYSNIGQPLPVNIIIDLHQHLGSALEAAEKLQPSPRGKKRRIRA